MKLQTNTPQYKKLNLGCGSRFASGWNNIDVYSAGTEVQKVNFLSPLPFKNGEFDAVYSSHVLEHFTPKEADHLLSEVYRILKPQGIIRIVVPDLESSCREYLSILDSCDEKKYSWIILELIDQMTRSTPSGEMGAYHANLAQGNDTILKDYVDIRSGLFRKDADTRIQKKISIQKFKNKFLYIYLKLVSHLFSANIRSQVMILTGLGERHRWMYDQMSMSLLLKKHRFNSVRKCEYNTSAINGFNEDLLDINADGSPYKRVSLYIEAEKPKS
ncbi:MAG: methyltransferase domain-containing protein [Chthoniobacterales bacterium]